MASIVSRFLLAVAWIFASTGCVPVVSPAEPPSSHDLGETPDRCIGLGNVLGIPSGSARGSQFSGRYRSLSNLLLDCVRCPLHTFADARCENVTVDPTHEYEVIQTDGRVVFDDGDVRVVGGVDGDGSFTIGAVITPTGTTGVHTGEGFALIEGRFDATGYNATLVTRITANDPDDAEDVVDVQGVSRVRAERTE